MAVSATKNADAASKYDAALVGAARPLEALGDAAAPAVAVMLNCESDLAL
jgi:hypothetical protein